MINYRTNTVTLLKILCCFFFIICLLSCSEPNKKHITSQITNNNPDSLSKKSSGSLNDTLFIDFPAAVVYIPDSLQLEKLKVITEPMAFESNNHECFYLLKFSRNEIQQNWPKIKIVEIENARFILFKSEEGNKECIDLNTRKDFCGIFLFDGHKKTLFADLANIATELGFYFSK